MRLKKEAKENGFTQIAGVKLVFQPEGAGRTPAKKHPCGDCHFCQFCSDSRCNACRGKDQRAMGPAPRKLSICEQIRLYEEINERAS